jgi:hypothetical protein
MRKTTLLRRLVLLSLSLGLGLLFPACQKVPETTPRYDKDACIVCSPTGHKEMAGKCFYCKGTAVCQFCAGKGKRLVGNKEHFYEEICSFCGGKGKCHYCEGTGICKTCGGTGKYTPPAASADTPGAVPRDTVPPVKQK